MKLRRLLPFAVTALVAASAFGAEAGTRKFLNSGACLSCHGGDIPVLPAQPCVSCHAGSMDLFGEGAAASNPPHGPNLRRLASPILAGIRAVASALSHPAYAAPRLAPRASRLAPPFPGAFLAAVGYACDLRPTLSPSGNSFLFSLRGPDTTADGRVDLRDAQALFLLRRGQDTPLRLTSYSLPLGASTAVWAPDGSRFCISVPAGGPESRHGLELFHASGMREKSLPPLDRDLMSSAFSPSGLRIAAVEGESIVVWDFIGGTSQKTPIGVDGSFPRLAGWEFATSLPLFTRGYRYDLQGRRADGKYDLPLEVPLEAAQGGKVLALTARGSRLVSRSRCAPRPEGVYYVGAAGASLGLFLWDGKKERLLTPEGWSVYAYAPDGDGRCAVLAAQAKGSPASLLWIENGVVSGDPGLRLRPSLLGLAASGGRALACGPVGDASSRPLFLCEPGSGAKRLGGDQDVWFHPAASGAAMAAVRVPADTDGDGERTPLDLGELWISWGKP